MENLALKHNCLKLLTVNLDNCIYIAGFVEKTNNLNEYLATAYMLKNPNKTLPLKKIEKLFLCDLPVFFLKKADMGYYYVQHEKYTNTRGKIYKVLTCSIDDSSENLYVAKIIIKIINTELQQDLTSYLFVCGNEDLEDFIGFFFLDN